MGGHCIPVDPYYLIQKATTAGAPVELITSARMVNSNMPIQVAKRVIEKVEHLADNTSDIRILILGWSYKPGISDSRETPAQPLSKVFKEFGCEVFVWDPYISKDEWTNSAKLIDSPFDGNCDVVVLCTAHPEVLGINWEKLRETSRLGLIYDGRRVLNQKILEEAGWIFTAVGMP